MKETIRGTRKAAAYLGVTKGAVLRNLKELGAIRRETLSCEVYYEFPVADLKAAKARMNKKVPV